MHRNSFLNSPGFLDRQFGIIGFPLRFFAGQITGVEGYVESIASGLLAGVTMAARIKGYSDPVIPDTTAIGALGRYISTHNRNFQPMNINFGLLPPLDDKVRGKQQRYLSLAERALNDLNTMKSTRPELFA
jgi:methylenetetrahydrofolate--tRNA-(uracil-5-)-methyltransferase